jgi:oligosaccharide 4-alpha-D-glucosyltransferase
MNFLINNMTMKKSIIILYLSFLILFPMGLFAWGFSTGDGSVVLKTGQGNLIITPYSANTIRVSLSETNQVTNTDAIFLKPQSIKCQTEEDSVTMKLKTDSLTLLINKTTHAIRFYDSQNRLISICKGFFSDSTYSGFRFSLAEDEMIFGGGEGAIPINRRGYRLHLDNEPHWGYGWGEENLNFSVPHFISSSNYSIFYDNGAVGYADIGKNDSTILEIASKSEAKSFFFICNSNQNDLHKSFSKLTGTQPMPPRWAMGNLMSRFGYQTEKEAREKLDSMLIAGYPVDAIILDLYWFGKGFNGWMMGDLDWYTPSWPTPQKMISDFQQKGVQTILVTEPYILETSKNFADADQKGLFATDSAGKTNIVEDFWFGKAGLLDLFKPETCNWYWKFYQKQAENGVAGWWGDLGEPEKFHDDLNFIAGKGPAVKNLYGHFWSKMLADKYDQFFPEKRLFHLNRAGFAGSQRYSSYPWSGDVSRTWGGFKAQLPNLLSMSLSNVPYAHSDLGGFCAEPKNEELYLRWLQFGVFNPIFRPHSEKVPSEPIYYSDSIQILVKPFFELRYKLLPYNYTLAWRQEQFGESLAAPLFMKTDLPKTLWGIFDEYFWGDAFLVAPVLEAGQKEKTVFLPNGVWFDFFSGERFLGNGYIKRKINLSTFPVFVKAGSFIPMVQPMVNTSAYDPSVLEIHYWFDHTIKQSNYTLYDDDGKTKGSFSKGKYELINFAFSNQADKMVFTLENTGGEYSGRPMERKVKMVFHNLPKGYQAEGLRIGDGLSIIEIQSSKDKSKTIIVKPQ